jgi:hypothetical protein
MNGLKTDAPKAVHDDTMLTMPEAPQFIVSIVASCPSWCGRQLVSVCAIK